MSDDTKQTQEVKAERTAKNSVFLDLFQDKKNLLALYKTLHPEDTGVTEDTLDIVTIDEGTQIRRKLKIVFKTADIIRWSE